jgi:hypothetical protein
MKVKGQTFFKVMAILFIIFGAFNIVGIFSGFAIFSEYSYYFNAFNVFGIYIAAILMGIIYGGLELATGIYGISNVKKMNSNKLNLSIILCVAHLVFLIISNILTVIALNIVGIGNNYATLVSGVLLPVLFIISAVSFKNNLNATAPTQYVEPIDVQDKE